MRTFGNIPPEYAAFESSAILLQSIPYDGTSTWGKGADAGFTAFLNAAEHLELYDIETQSEVYQRGIHMPPAIKDFKSPEEMYGAVLQHTRRLLDYGKFLTFFGGEHSVSIGIIQAFASQYPDLTVIQIDAHTDLRESYQGSPYNHACALHLASKTTNLIQVGIRSMDSSEVPFCDLEKCFFMADINGSDGWIGQVLEKVSGPVYITFDLDAFDPSVMPSTGTPEPGGFFWYDVLKFLKAVFGQTEVAGFDIVELAPIDGLRGPDFLAAKLYYKMLSYKFSTHE